jgi:hypothetical protein
MKNLIEEIAEQFEYTNGKYGFKEGVKWQEKRSYSEEEVIKILYQFHYDLVNSNFDSKKEWFEQFKKK